MHKSHSVAFLSSAINATVTITLRDCPIIPSHFSQTRCYLCSTSSVNLLHGESSTNDHKLTNECVLCLYYTDTNDIVVDLPHNIQFRSVLKWMNFAHTYSTVALVPTMSNVVLTPFKRKFVGLLLV